MCLNLPVNALFHHWECPAFSNEVDNLSLIYVDNGNKFYEYDLKTERIAQLSSEIDRTGTITSFYYDVGLNAIVFVEENHPNVKTTFKAWQHNNQLTHALIKDSVKEFAFTQIPFTQFVYVITQDNHIKLLNSPKILVHPVPDTQYRNLLFNPQLGQMLWIAETSKEYSIKLAGMDGRNVRNVLTLNKIKNQYFTFSLVSPAERFFEIAVDLDTLYLSAANIFTEYNMTSKDRHSALHFDTSGEHRRSVCHIVYFRCGFYYVDRVTKSIQVVTDKWIKRLVNLTTLDLPFILTRKTNRFYNINTECIRRCTEEEMCIYGEGDNKAIVYCMQLSDEWSWLSIVLLVLAFSLFALIAEFKFQWIKKLWHWFGLKCGFYSDNLIDAAVLFKKSDVTD